MRRFIKSSFAATYLFALAAGGLAIAASPSVARANEECTIKCEKCTCNLNTGICDCTNCTTSGCKPADQ